MAWYLVKHRENFYLFTFWHSLLEIQENQENLIQFRW